MAVLTARRVPYACAKGEKEGIGLLLRRSDGFSPPSYGFKEEGKVQLRLRPDDALSSWSARGKMERDRRCPMPQLLLKKKRLKKKKKKEKKKKKKKKKKFVQKRRPRSAFYLYRGGRGENCDEVQSNIFNAILGEKGKELKGRTFFRGAVWKKVIRGVKDIYVVISRGGKEPVGRIHLVHYYLTMPRRIEQHQWYITTTGASKEHF